MFKAFIRLFVTLGGLSLGLAASVAAQAQTMSTSQVERILDGMMGQPVSLFLGVPMAYDKLWAMDLDGSGSSFDVTLVGANLLGQDLGDLQLQAKVSGDARLDLRLDLSALFEGLAAMNQTAASVGTLRIDARLDTERGGYERFQLVVDDLFAADGSNPEDDFLRVDGAIFTYDESEQSPLVTLDFGLDGIRFSEGGNEQFTFETLGASFELINLPDWLLHVEANNAVQQFFMAQAGLMPPTLAAANVLESLAPLFEEDLIDLASSVEIGEITMNDVYVEGVNADIAFGGLAFGTSFDAASGLGLSAGDIGSLTIDLSSSWDEEAEPYRLLNFEGARFDAETLYNDGYSLRPLGAILRDVAAEVRSLSPEDLAQPEALITDLYFNHVSTLVDWALSSVQSSTTDFATGALALVNQDEWEPLSLVMDSLYYNSDLEVDAASGSDRQSLTVGLAGLVLEVPEDITVKAGDLNLTYGLNNALSVIREVLGSLEDSTLSMGDAIRLGFAVYLPDLVMTARDLNLEVSSPLDGGALSIDLAALDFGLMTDGMNSDAGTLSLVFEQDGLAVSLDDQSLDPRLLDLVLGGQDVGLLPTTIAMQVDLADIPMATLLTIAESVMLPPIEVMAEPGFDPSSLAFGAVALLSPLLSSPPSIVVQPSEISGGLVGVTAEGRVQISPLTEPNRALGSVTLRVKGVNELSARAGRLMAELSGDQSAAAVQSMELLQGLMGFAMMAGGFGAPSDDGALEFVIDIPAGAPANINGLPIPLPF